MPQTSGGWGGRKEREGVRGDRHGERRERGREAEKGETETERARGRETPTGGAGRDGKRR